MLAVLLRGPDALPVQGGATAMSTESWIQLGLVILLVGGAITITSYLVTMRKDLEIMIRELRALRKAVNNSMVRRSEMMLWIATLRGTNKDVISVPDLPENTEEYIEDI